MPQHNRPTRHSRSHRRRRKGLRLSQTRTPTTSTFQRSTPQHHTTTSKNHTYENFEVVLYRVRRLIQTTNDNDTVGDIKMRLDLPSHTVQRYAARAIARCCEENAPGDIIEFGGHPNGVGRSPKERALLARTARKQHRPINDVSGVSSYPDVSSDDPDDDPDDDALVQDLQREWDLH